MIEQLPFHFHFHALEKEMETHSSVLAWRIPGTGEPGGLLSMGSHRVGQDGSDLAAAAVAVSIVRDVNLMAISTKMVVHIEIYEILHTILKATSPKLSWPGMF